MNIKHIAIFIVLIGFFTIFLFGCTGQKIDFNWESKADKVMKEAGSNIKPKVEVSKKGTIIYHMNQEQNQPQNRNQGQFGPSFDLPMRF